MLQIGVQTQNVISDLQPDTGFQLLAQTGFTCADFSLNSYLSNSSIYRSDISHFFDRTGQELETFFKPHKLGAETAGITISQMHMPYPLYVSKGSSELNDYLIHEVAPKSMVVCDFLGCPYIVVHGFKLARFLGTEESEWAQTEKFIDSIAPMAKEMGITVCIENLYERFGRHIIEGPCCDAKKAADRIDRMNEKYGAEVLGFCFDTGHANLVGIDFEDFIVTLGSRLKVLHIHDNDGIGDLHQIPFTFTRNRENTSSTDWEGFVSGLRKINYNGVLSFETAPVLASFPQELKQGVLEFLSRIGQYWGEKIVE